jgi:hypothetical protein
MAGITIQRRRGTTTQHQSFTGKPGEMTIDTTKWVIVVHDGTTTGGVPMAKEAHSHSNATTGLAGFMSAADKTKLDALPLGGIYNQTIQANSSPVNQRHQVNFGSSFVVTDDAGGDRTTIDLADSGVTPGAYTKLTVNAKGRVSSGTVLSPSDLPNFTSVKITDFDAKVASVRLDQFALPMGDVNLSGYKLINVDDPTNPADAATKQYVDAVVTGLTIKEAVRAASVGNVTISGPGSTLDGVSLSPGDRVLLKNQTNKTQNGIWVFTSAGQPLQRALDADTGAEFKAGTFVLCTEGNTNADIGFVNASDGPLTIGVDEITITEFSSPLQVTAGDGVEMTGSTLSVKSANTNRIAVGPSGVDLASIAGLSAGTYNNVTVNTFGQVTAANNVSYQPLANILSSIAALGTNGVLCRTASGVSNVRVLSAGTGISINNADGVSGNPTVAQTADSVLQKVKVSKDGAAIGTRSEVNFVTGSGIALNVAENSGSNRVDVTIAATSGGQAPNDSTYITFTAEPSLTGSRRLVLGSTMTMTDGGAGGDITLNIVTDLGSVP